MHYFYLYSPISKFGLVLGCLQYQLAIMPTRHIREKPCYCWHAENFCCCEKIIREIFLESFVVT